MLHKHRLVCHKGSKNQLCPKVSITSIVAYDSHQNSVNLSPLSCSQLHPKYSNLSEVEVVPVIHTDLHNPLLIQIAVFHNIHLIIYMMQKFTNQLFSLHNTWNWYLSSSLWFYSRSSGLFICFFRDCYQQTVIINLRPLVDFDISNVHPSQSYRHSVSNRT